MRVKSGEQRGVALLEFTAVALPLFMLIFLIIGIGIALFRHSLLIHATGVVARQMAVDVRGNTQCADLAAAAVVAAQSSLQTTYGVSSGTIAFSARIDSPTSETCYLRITGDWPLPGLLRGPVQMFLRVAADSAALIEDRCYQCTGSCAS